MKRLRIMVSAVALGLTAILPAEALEKRDLEYVGGLWRVVVSHNGLHVLDQMEAALFPKVNTRCDPDYVVGVVRHGGPGGDENVRLIRVSQLIPTQGESARDDSRLLLDGVEGTGSSLGLKAQRRINEMTWSRDGNHLLVACIQRYLGEETYPVQVIDVSGDAVDRPFDDESVRRSEFVLLARGHLVYSEQGAQIIEIDGRHQTQRVAEHATDIILGPDASLIYTRLPDNNPGIYQMPAPRMMNRTPQERLLVNLPVFAEIKAQLADDGRLAFLSNYSSDFNRTSGGRNQLKQYWRPYVASVSELERMSANRTQLTSEASFQMQVKRLTTDILVKDYDPEELIYHSIDLVKWFDGWLWFEAQGGKHSGKIFSVNPDNTETQVWQPGPIEDTISITTESGVVTYKIEGQPSSISGFDIFSHGDRTYTVISTTVSGTMTKQGFGANPFSALQTTLVYEVPK